MAEGGSLLLDEIGEMPPYLQTKLLRVLQEREYRPIGSDRIVHVDFRLICATNIDLDAALRDGRLREDLYFRINTITLRVPPLRERTEDIPLLCDYFLDKFRQRYQRNVKTLAPAVYHLLIRNRWPGNVRELENAIERAVLVAKGTEITVGDLPESIREESPGTTDFVIPPHRTLAEIEKMAILQTLQRTNWNKQEAAQILGLYRPTLYSKMKKHDIQDARQGARASRSRRGRDRRAQWSPDESWPAVVGARDQANPRRGAGRQRHRQADRRVALARLRRLLQQRQPHLRGVDRLLRAAVAVSVFAAGARRSSAARRPTSTTATRCSTSSCGTFPRQFDFITTQLDAFRRQHDHVRRRRHARAHLGRARRVRRRSRTAVNYAWGVEKTRSFWKHKLFSFLMLLRRRRAAARRRCCWSARRRSSARPGLPACSSQLSRPG